MKRFIAVLAVLLVLCCSCGKQAPEKPREAIPEAPLEAEAIPEAPEMPTEPPNMLIFTDIAQYRDFQNSVELSDDDFALYLSENSFDLNGIDAKDDVAEICSRVDALPVPSAHGLSLTEMTIYPETEQCFFRYTTSDGTICSYLFSFNQSKADAAIQAKENGDLQAVPFSSNDVSDVYYVVNKKGDTMQSYYAKIDGYTVLFRAYQTTSSEALELLQSADFIRF